MSTFQLDVISPDRTLFSGAVQSVQLPGVEGSFEVLLDHAALISPLEAGTVRLRDAQGQAQAIDVPGGVVEVLHNRVVVLVS
jgi:F-type H+-transporting ATPase subunit epsilon